MVLRRFGDKITEGLGSITTQDELREAHRIIREKTKDAAKGL